MNKKVIFGIVLALVVLALTMPYVTGRIAQQATIDLQQRMLSDTDQFGDFDIQQYQRGVFSSEASFSWKPPKGLAGLTADRIAFNCVGDHGVLSYQYDCKVKDWAGYQEFVNQQLKGDDPLTVQGAVTLSGEINNQVLLREFRFKTESEDIVSVAAGELNIRTRPNTQRFVIDGSFDGAELKSDAMLAQLGDTEFNADLHLNQHQIVIGAASLVIDKATLADRQDAGVEIRQVSLQTDSIEREEFFDFSYQLKIAEIFQGALSLPSNSRKSYQNLDMMLAIGNINMANFSKFYRNFKRIDEVTSDATRSGEAKSDSNANFLAMLPQFEDLFRQGANLQSRLKVTTPTTDDEKSEDLSAELKIELLNNLRFADYILMRVQPGALLAKFDAQFNASIPHSMVVAKNESASDLAADSQVQAPGLSGSPWYLSEGNTSVSEVVVKGEEITVNGRRLSPGEFIRMLF